MGKSVKKKLSKQSRKVIRNKNISKSKRSSRKKKVSRKSSSKKRKKSKKSRRKKKVMRGGGGIIINDLKNKSDISFVLNGETFLGYDIPTFLSFNIQNGLPIEKRVSVERNIFQPKTNRKKSKDSTSTLTSTEIIDIGKFSPDGKTVTLKGTTYKVVEIESKEEHLSSQNMNTGETTNTVYYITITEEDKSN
jgi:hypothetical protein